MLATVVVVPSPFFFLFFLPYRETVVTSPSPPPWSVSMKVKYAPARSDHRFASCPVNAPTFSWRSFCSLFLAPSHNSQERSPSDCRSQKPGPNHSFSPSFPDLFTSQRECSATLFTTLRYVWAPVFGRSNGFSSLFHSFSLFCQPYGPRNRPSSRSCDRQIRAPPSHFSLFGLVDMYMDVLAPLCFFSDARWSIELCLLRS